MNICVYGSADVPSEKCLQAAKALGSYIGKNEHNLVFGGFGDGLLGAVADEAYKNGAKSNDGYHNKKTDFRSYFLTFDDGARLEIMNKPEMSDLSKDLARTGYVHIAFSVGSKEKVDALTAELKADGYEVISGPRTTGDGYYESCVVAVEGNQVEITV